MPRKKPSSQPSEYAMEMLSQVFDPAILLDTDYRILAANEAYHEEMNGADDLSGRHCYEVSHGFDRPCDQAGESCPLKASIVSKHKERMLHIHLSSHGREFVDVEIQPFRESAAEPAYFLEVLRPVQIASAIPSATGLVGDSPAFNEMLELVQRVASEETAVLLQGESGTGKELIARAVHEGSPRVKMPFVPVECSGLTESLFESELFGHRKGAFTGAHYDKLGLVESAHEGTLFLDEIGEMTPQLQVKLLRLLETQTFRKVGSTESKYVNFRLVCATNRNLLDMVSKGEFRNDLYYRLSAFPIELPPLRERREDIELLANSLLRRNASPHEFSISSDAMNCLKNYEFPGNIRELQNILERARILATGTTLECEHFPGVCSGERHSARIATDQVSSDNQFVLRDVQPLDAVEQQYLQYLVASYSGTRSELAKELGVSLRTLTRKLQGLS